MGQVGVLRLGDASAARKSSLGFASGFRQRALRLAVLGVAPAKRLNVAQDDIR